MFGSEILEVAIGVIFVFLLISIICTAVREGIETALKTRSAYLEQGVRELLHDPEAVGLVTHLYQHPLVHSLFPGEYKPKPAADQTKIFARGHNLPSYIPARNFATALMDIAARGPATQPGNSGPNAPMVTAESIRANIRNIQNPAVQRVLLTALDEAKNDLDRARQNVENWFDSAMDRVSGHYKRASQKIIFGIGLLVAVAVNVDTLRVAHFLYTDDTARAAIVARAERAVESGDSVALRVTGEQARTTLDSLHLPIGWTRFSFTPRPDPAVVRAWRDSLARVAAQPTSAAAAGAAETARRPVSPPVAVPLATASDSARVWADSLRADSLRRVWRQRQDSQRLVTVRADSARLDAVALDRASVRPGVLEEPGYWGRTLANILVFALLSIPGWLITAGAATLGAPFWFDVLNKVMVIRSTVKPREKSPEEGSEDRQNKATVAPTTSGAVSAGAQGAALAQVAAPEAGAAAPAVIIDDEEHLEGCGIQGEEETLDEELPPAQGGVG